MDISDGKDAARRVDLVQHRASACVFVSPFRCRMWAMHDRIEEAVTDETCKAEIESFLKHGQLLPVLGRPIHSDPDCDVELIYGSRRLFVARHLNKHLAVKLQPISDRDAFIAMDIENRHRMDISPYERGKSYARWLRAGFFSSQDELAKELRVSPSQVSRLLKIARLPSVVVGAFASPVEIHERWGLELAEAWEDPLRRAEIASAARQIATEVPRLPARVVHQRILRGRRIPRRNLSRDTVVKSSAGRPLFRVRYQQRAVVLWLPVKTTPPHAVTEISQCVAEILQRATTQAAET